LEPHRRVELRSPAWKAGTSAAMLVRHGDSAIFNALAIDVSCNGHSAPRAGAQHGYKVPSPARRFWRPTPAQRLPVCIIQKAACWEVSLLAASGLLTGYPEASGHKFVPGRENWRMACASSRQVICFAVFMTFTLRRVRAGGH
jgi:hypothetical protein